MKDTVNIEAPKLNIETIYKQFIEILIQVKHDKLRKTILHGNTYTLNIQSFKNDIYIFTHKQIIFGEYRHIFVTQSAFIRDISYYKTDINHKRYKKQEPNLVSFYTKFPNKLRSLFGPKIRVIGNTLNNVSDFDVLSGLLNDAEITSDYLKKQLQQTISKQINALSMYNTSYSLVSYSSIEELFNEINRDNYTLTISDLYYLSLILRRGFCLFTNYYTYNKNKFTFELFIIIHDDLIHPFYLERLQLYSLYQDIDNEDSSMSNIQYIENDGRTLFSIRELMKYPSFKRECKINYLTIHDILTN